MGWSSQDFFFFFCPDSLEKMKKYFSFSLLLVSSFASGWLAAASPTISSRGPHVLHEKRSAPVPDKWNNVGRAPFGSTLNVRIGLKESNLDKAHEYMHQL